MLKEIQGPMEVKPFFRAQLQKVKNSNFNILSIEAEKEKREIPVFSVRNPDHHRLIAEKIVSGEVGAFEVGVIGVLMAVPSVSSGNEGQKFWDIKRGRKTEEKVPMMMLPKNQDKIIDFDKLHPDFSYLKDPQARDKFFGTIPFHAILPLADNAVINKNVFVTNYSKGEFSSSTVCVFFSGGDKAWENIANLASHINPDVHLGISSFNDHGEQSPYNLNELVSYVNKKQRADFDFIVSDPVVSKYDIKSSMTIIRLPQANEDPEIAIVRKGSIGADTLRMHMRNIKIGGHSVSEPANVKIASHGHSEEVRSKGLDNRVLGYLSEINS